MKNDEFYRPAVIEFNVAHDGSLMPESLGSFETPEDMAKFVGGTLTAVNQAVTVMRHMDVKEKKEIQEKYSELLENIVPIYKTKLYEAELALADAKKALKEAEERYNAEMADVQDLASEKKRGLRDMNLDEKYTFRVPYQGRYYFYTWIDKVLKLCLIRQIPETEKQDLFNAMANNEEYIDKTFAPKPEPKSKK
jgi:hypothetical protein